MTFWFDVSILPQLNHLPCTFLTQTVKEYWITSNNKRVMFLLSFVQTIDIALITVLAQHFVLQPF